jgi:phage head maturation protease
VVVPTGLANREEFLLNPVVLWAHQRALPPVGTCVSLDVQPHRVVAVTKFAAGVPLADDVFRLCEQGVVRGWSVGLLPRRAAPVRGRRGWRIEEWDLLEYSAVPVPENPQALTVAVEKGLVRDRSLRDWLVHWCSDPFGELVA